MAAPTSSLRSTSLEPDHLPVLPVDLRKPDTLHSTGRGEAKLKEDWKLSVSLRQGRFAECLLTWKQPSRWFVIIVQLQRQQGYIYWTDSWWALRCVLRTQLSQAPWCYLVNLSVWVKEDYKIVSVATSCQYMEEGMRRLKTIQMCFRYRFF